jgi:hypothetical protein
MGITIEHRIGVKAPPEAIWEVIADIEGWGRWNPVYPRAEGKLRIGGGLTLDVALSGHPLQTIRPVVLDWIPNEQIHWRVKAAGGLIRTTRFLEIEKLTETGCIFANGEVFDGPLGGLAVRRVGRAVRQAFRTMSEIVKARAEGAWTPGGEAG